MKYTMFSLMECFENVTYKLKLVSNNYWMGASKEIVDLLAKYDSNR